MMVRPTRLSFATLQGASRPLDVRWWLQDTFDGKCIGHDGLGQWPTNSTAECCAHWYQFAIDICEKFGRMLACFVEGHF